MSFSDDYKVVGKSYAENFKHVLQSVLYRSDIRKYQRYNDNKNITLTKEETENLRHQLLVRRYHTELDMLTAFENGDIEESKKYKEEVNKLDKLINKTY